MAVSVRGRNCLKSLDYTPEKIRYPLGLSKKSKNMKRNGVPHRCLENRNIMLLFEKTSTRTRYAFEAAGMDLGMKVTYLDPDSSQMGKKESIADTARVLGRMYDEIEYRGFNQKIVDELIEYVGVPMWNELTDQLHPTQMLTDLLALEKRFGRLGDSNFTYMGDVRNNMGNSLMMTYVKVGINFTAHAPKELFPAEELANRVRKITEKSGYTVCLTEGVDRGAKGMDTIYTDIWVSMGKPNKVRNTRIKLFRSYQVNAEVMRKAKPPAIFMHCLPSPHDTNTTIGAKIAKRFDTNEIEATNEVFELEQSVIFDGAESRTHTIKAVIYATLC